VLPKGEIGVAVGDSHHCHKRRHKRETEGIGINLFAHILTKCSNKRISENKGKTTICAQRPFDGGPLGRVGASRGFKHEILCLVVQCSTTGLS